MGKINSLFRYIGYVSISLLIGWLSNYSGDENDFVLKISSDIIPLLVTILAFYVTILALILKELVDFKNQKGGNIKEVLKSMRRDMTIEILLIVCAFLCYTIRGALVNILSVDWQHQITILSNSVTVFSFIYFLLLIFDSIMGLWNLIEANNVDCNDQN